MVATEGSWVIPALTGGLAGAAFTVSLQHAYRHWTRPILSMVFSNDAGCVVPARGWMFDQKSGKPILDQSGAHRQGATRYLRIKIENRGLTFAQNVSVYVTKLTCDAAGSGTTTFEEEVFDLSVANSALERKTFNLAAGAHQFIDLVHTEDTNPGGHMVFDFGKAAHRLEDLKPKVDRSATYTARVFASAENAGSVTREVRWECGTSLDSLKIV